jgi:hypothetical protein
MASNNPGTITTGVRAVRYSIATIVGLAVAFAVSLGLQFAAHAVHPMPDDLYAAVTSGTALTESQQAALVTYMANAPVAAMALVLLGYVIGSFAAGFVIAKLASGARFKVAIFAGVVLTGVGVWNLMAIPHPMWFNVASSATYVPMAFFGAMIGGGKKKK